MTDRLKGLVVTFENEIREDDAQDFINAIYLLKGVIKVEPITIDFQDRMNLDKAKYELRNKIIDLLK